MNQCPVCNYPIEKQNRLYSNPLYNEIVCYKCGEYKLHEDAESLLESYTDEDRVYLSGWLVENPNSFVDYEVVKKKKSYRKFSPAEKAEKLLLGISYAYPNVGEKIIRFPENFGTIFTSKSNDAFPNIGGLRGNDIKKILKIISQSYVNEIRELEFLYIEYLANTNGYLSEKGNSRVEYFISPKGWEYIASLQKSNIESSVGFIAMRFLPDIIQFCDDHIYTAIKLAGYKPLRINDKDDLKESIDYEIAAAIRSSKFVIADFTYNSYGVYYEAGFARGYNIPIIYTCRDSDFHEKDKKPHFDVEHYPFIFWDEGTEKKFVKKLKAWIEATVGHGPLEFPEVQGFDLS